MAKHDVWPHDRSTNVNRAIDSFLSTFYNPPVHKQENEKKRKENQKIRNVK